MSFWEVRFMFALIPYFCLWVSVAWHSCSMWIIVNRWSLQWVQVGGVVFLTLCSCVSLVWPVLGLILLIIISSFLLLKFGVCWWKSWILLCSWVLLVVFHLLFHSFFTTDYWVCLSKTKYSKQITNLLLDYFYPVISYRRVPKESDELLYTRFGRSLWSAIS